LDTEAVFQRLIGDVYEHPSVFVRELIQNALDATRCQLYLDLKNRGDEIPEFPTQAPEDTRKDIHIIRLNKNKSRMSSQEMREFRL
jgi:HSP90 family molecular chaperone